MTIAVGIVGPHFLIVGADSEEGWWGAGQTLESNKIAIGTLKHAVDRTTQRGRIAVTGAGGSDYLAYLKSRGSLTQ